MHSVGTAEPDNAVTLLRAGLPFVHTKACDLPGGAEALMELSGTTVSRRDRVTAGTFPDRLFYRLNVIHLIQGDRPDGRPTPSRPR